MICWRTIAVMALVLLPVAAEGEESGEPSGAASAAFRTWAVLSSPDLHSSGLEDQVIAGLSPDQAIMLVDRAHLDLVAKELSLSGMSNSSGTGLRQKAGRIVKADALVLLSRETAAGKDLVRLIICECRCGARLRVDYMPLENGKVEAAARQILAAIQETRRHFPQGLRQVLGVPPFVSRTLTHEYDYLQRGCSALLANALSLQPGTAVIEVEEAQQIAREIGLTDGKDVDRLVPLLVEGEFVVPNVVGQGEPRIEFTVRVRRASAVAPRELRDTVPLAAAARYITVDLPPRILQTSAADSGSVFSPDEQFRWLAERADAFLLLGFWDHAAGLREAALLLKPEAVKQRLALIDEYQRLASRSRSEASWEERTRIGSPALRAAVMRDVETYLAGLAHLEYLIRNRQISASQAVKVFGEQTAHSLLRGGLYLVIDKGKPYLTGQAELEPAEQAQRRFLTDVYPHVLSLSRQEYAPYQFPDFELLNDWYKVLVGAALARVDRPYYTKADLDWCYRVLAEMAPDGMVTQYDVEGFLGSGGERNKNGVKFPDEISAQDWLDFLKRLTESKQGVARVYGRYGQLKSHWQRNGQHEPAETRMALLKDLDALLKDFAALPYAIPTKAGRTYESMYEDIRLWRDLVARDNQTPEEKLAASKFTLPPKPPGWEKDPRQWKIYGRPETLGRLKFDKIAIKVVQPSGSTASLKNTRIEKWRPCGPGRDVLWHRGGVLLMQKKGLAKTILLDPRAVFDDVQWDGKTLWVGTEQAGIWIVSPAGELLAKVAATQGLPPAEHGVMLYPLEPGKIFAAGSFGEPRRAWCAIVTAEGKDARVRVFHEATHISDGRGLKQTDDDTHLGFTPGWLHEYHGLPGSRRTLLVGRQWAQASRPLAIDLETLTVSVFPPLVAPYGHAFHPARSESCFSRNGDILEASQGAVTRWAAPGRTLPDGKNPRHYCSGSGLHECILPYNGWLYVPGQWWFRINPESFAEELLVPGQLPQKYVMPHLTVSAHYGLVAWGTHGEDVGLVCYQVTVLDAPAAGVNSRAKP